MDGFLQNESHISLYVVSNGIPIQCKSPSFIFGLALWTMVGVYWGGYIGWKIKPQTKTVFPFILSVLAVLLGGGFQQNSH